MNKVWEAKTQNIYLLKNVAQNFFSLWSTVGKTVTKKTSWILDFTGFYCPSEFSGL